MKVLKKIKVEDIIYLPGAEIDASLVTLDMVVHGFVQELLQRFLFDSSSNITIDKPPGNRNR